MKCIFKNQWFVFALLLVVFLSSCEKNKKDLPTETESSLTAEQQKERLDQEGIDFIDHITGIEKPELTDPLAYFVEIVQQMKEDQFVFAKRIGNSLIINLKNISSEPTLKSLLYFDESSLKELMEDNQGLYTYDRNTNTWKKTDADKIEFKFPSGENSASNDASLIISNLTLISVTNSNLYEGLADLPKTLNIDFKINNEVKYSVRFVTEYNDDNIPVKEVVTLAMGQYKMNEEFVLSKDKLLSMKFSMSLGDNIFMSMGATSEGSFTNEVIIDENSVAEDIFSKINTYFQIENVKIVGDLNFNNLAVNLENLEKKYENQYNYYSDQYPKAYYEECVASLKAEGVIKVLFADKNEVFAKIEPYVKSEEDWYYDWSSYDYKYVEYTRNDVGFRFVFTDGSQLDESYFDYGFSSFIDNLNAFINKINRDYDEQLDLL